MSRVTRTLSYESESEQRNDAGVIDFGGSSGNSAEVVHSPHINADLRAEPKKKTHAAASRSKHKARIQGPTTRSQKKIRVAVIRCWPAKHVVEISRQRVWGADWQTQ